MYRLIICLNLTNLISTFSIPDIIGTLEAIKLTQQESIHGLEEQMKDLKSRLQEVESEKAALLSSQSDESSQLSQQLKIMSKVG